MREPEQLGPELVLVVDDDAVLCAAHSRILTAAGFKVDSCESAEDAAKRLRQGERFLVIVTDLCMPGMDGIDLLALARQLDAEMPVVIVTGRPSLRTTIAAVEHHSFRYLVKPVTPLTLGETVSAAAATYRLSVLKRRALEICENDGWRTDAGSLAERFDSALQQLYMMYQPIVSPAACFGFEALVRTGESTFRGPDQLFSAAERLGRVQELGRAIRALVSADIANAPAESAVFVNLHANDLTDGELYSPHAALSAHASRIVLEITERRSLDGVADVRSRLAELRKLGYRIAVDDLGAGYAGLSCFNLLEPEVVKLDMSLIRDIDSEPRKRALVESMVRVCMQDLGMQVVCEGVETAEERDVLVALGAPLLQGYLFGRPARGFPSPRELVLHSEQRLIASPSDAAGIKSA
jgi:EAL domain-containing protein (putative c-di-GMP-specific phosphodiesterase class I)/ActR/RegA family two-component response regulator